MALQAGGKAPPFLRGALFFRFQDIPGLKQDLPFFPCGFFRRHCAIFSSTDEGHIAFLFCRSLELFYPKPTLGVVLPSHSPAGGSNEVSRGALPPTFSFLPEIGFVGPTGGYFLPEPIFFLFLTSGLSTGWSEKKKNLFFPHVPLKATGPFFSSPRRLHRSGRPNPLPFFFFFAGRKWTFPFRYKRFFSGSAVSFPWTKKNGAPFFPRPRQKNLPQVFSSFLPACDFRKMCQLGRVDSASASFFECLSPAHN